MGAVLPEIPLHPREPTEFGQLRAGEKQRETALEANHDSIGNEAHDGTRFRQPGSKRNHRDQQSRAGRQRAKAGNVTVRQSAERRTDQQRDGGGDRHGGVFRIAEKPERQPREQAGIQTGLGRQSSERSVADGLRHEVRCERHSGNQIAAKPPAIIFT